MITPPRTTSPAPASVTRFLMYPYVPIAGTGASTEWTRTPFARSTSSSWAGLKADNVIGLTGASSAAGSGVFPRTQVHDV